MDKLDYQQNLAQQQYFTTTPASDPVTPFLEDSE